MHVVLHGKILLKSPKKIRRDSQEVDKESQIRLRIGKEEVEYMA